MRTVNLPYTMKNQKFEVLKDSNNKKCIKSIKLNYLGGFSAEANRLNHSSTPANVSAFADF